MDSDLRKIIGWAAFGIFCYLLLEALLPYIVLGLIIAAVIFIWREWNN